MKYLSDYIEDEQTKLFEELGVFFAFNREQLEAGVAKYGHLKPEGTKWADLGSGMFVPSVNVSKLDKRLRDIKESGIKADLAENGREGVLARELMNYEIGYSYDGHRDPNFRSGIDGYGFTEEEIKTAYNKIMQETEW